MEDGKMMDELAIVTLAAQTHVQFLKIVHTRLPKPSHLQANQAVCRYTQFWIPFLRDNLRNGVDITTFIPPVDIAWAWYCHRLYPQAYTNDCIEIFGCEELAYAGLELFFQFQSEDGASLTGGSAQFFDAAEETKKMWKSFYRVMGFKVKESFFAEEIPKDQDESKIEKSTELSIDLEEAVVKMRSYCYQVWTPDYEDPEFLQRGTERYFNFMKLYKMGEIPIVPTNDIDLIWRTHMLDPELYARHSQEIVGRIVDYWMNDITDEMEFSEGSQTRKNFRNTMDLWHKFFANDYPVKETLYRGPPPDKFWEIFFPKQATPPSLSTRLASQANYVVIAAIVVIIAIIIYMFFQS